MNDVSDIDQYALFVRKYWLSTSLEERDLNIMKFGLAEEVGEVMALFKREARGDSPLNVDKLKKELGDVLYYWTMICVAHNMTPGEVIAANVDKITGRNERGTLKGTGDDR